MKRKPLTLCLALLLVVGAALWGVNYRLDHPPLTKADKEFRALVASADSAKIDQYDTRNLVAGQNAVAATCVLSATQTRELVEQMRLGKPQPAPSIPVTLPLKIIFKHGDDELVDIQIDQSPGQTEVLVPKNAWPSTSAQKFAPTNLGLTVYRLHPRFEKPFRRALDAYLPQRIRP